VRELHVSSSSPLLQDGVSASSSVLLGKNPTYLDQEIGRKLPLETKREELQSQLVHLPQKMASYGNTI